MHTNTFVRATAKGHITERVPLLLCSLLGKAIGIKAVGIAPIVGHAIGENGYLEDHGICRDVVPGQFTVPNAASNQNVDRGVQALGFMKGVVHLRHRRQVFIFQLRFVQAKRFLPEALLPLRYFR